MYKGRNGGSRNHGGRTGAGAVPGRRKSTSGRSVRLWAVSLLAWMLAGIIGISGFMAVRVSAAPEDPALEAAAEAAKAEEAAKAAAREDALGEGQEGADRMPPDSQAEDMPKEPEKEPVIVIDPGHGGMDDGCVRDGIREKDINLQIAQLVSEKLTRLGYPVRLTRQEDVYVSKEDRVEEANQEEALIYVSIHQNSCEDTGAVGIETWYDGNDVFRNSGRLARLINQETAKSAGAVERELVGESDLCVTTKTNMPACLIETGFLTNPNERGLLVDGEYQDKIAEGIAAGIDLYFHPKTMYLTFDDGPSEKNTDIILDILKERNVTATFFVIGEYVRKHPKTARRIAEEGHTVGIHCDVHDYDVLYQSADSYIEDFERAYDSVREIMGVEARLFRFPGGSVNAYNKEVCQEIVERMEEKGYIYFDWNASLEDAGGQRTPEELIACARETSLDRKKVVLLAHDRVEATAQCLGSLIESFPDYQMKPLTTYIEPIQFRRFWEKSTFNLHFFLTSYRFGGYNRKRQSLIISRS